jgi:diadenylate cyclase
MSEVSDAFVICVSEETGNVSYAVGGHITRAVPKEELREQLIQLQGKTEKDNKIFTLKKGRRGNERQAEK